MQAEQRSGYSVSLLHVADAEAYLLVPDVAMQQKCPAVLLLHDHGAHFSIGKEKMVSPLWRTDLDSVGNALLRRDAQMWTDKFYSGIFLGDSLARAGYVVLVADALYWGSRAVNSLAWNTASWDELKAYNKALKEYQPTFYQDCSRQGFVWFERILQDDRAALSYLLSLPYVDTQRVVSMGFSMGAYRSWQLASADSRISACAASNWMGVASMMGGYLLNQSSYSMYRPSLYLPSEEHAVVDYPDIAAGIAPRPFLLQYGTADPVCPLASAESAIARIAQEYADNPSAFQPIAYQAQHLFTRAHYEALLDWLRAL